MAMARVQGVKALAGMCGALRGTGFTASATASGSFVQMRESSSVPEFWGRNSPYHPGTEFLGTPKNHLELVAKRPLSPHVFGLNSVKPHYKMPAGAISSITNRATGFALSLGTGAVALAALSGDLPALVAAVQGSALLIPVKAAVSFPLVYHYAAGMRHFYWDKYAYPNMAQHTTPLEVKSVKASSAALLGGSAIAAAALALVTL